MAAPRFLLILIATAALLVPIVRGQVMNPCTTSMITSFTPCLNFLTNSSGNGTSPTTDCCDALRSLASNAVECMCMFVMGGVPFPANLPINRTLAISLPRACNVPRLPLQCKASAEPIPAPGPMAFGPIVLPPGASPTVNPTETGTDSTPDTQVESPAETDTPPATSATPGSHPLANPPASGATDHVPASTFFLFAILGSLIMKAF